MAKFVIKNKPEDKVKTGAEKSASEKLEDLLSKLNDEINVAQGSVASIDDRISRQREGVFRSADMHSTDASKEYQFNSVEDFLSETSRHIQSISSANTTEELVSIVALLRTLIARADSDDKIAALVGSIPIPEGLTRAQNNNIREKSLKLESSGGDAVEDAVYGLKRAVIYANVIIDLLKEKSAMEERVVQLKDATGSINTMKASVKRLEGLREEVGTFAKTPETAYLNPVMDAAAVIHRLVSEIMVGVTHDISGTGQRMSSESNMLDRIKTEIDAALANVHSEDVTGVLAAADKVLGALAAITDLSEVERKLEDGRTQIGCAITEAVTALHTMAHPDAAVELAIQEGDKCAAAANTRAEEAGGRAEALGAELAGVREKLAELQRQHDALKATTAAPSQVEVGEME